MSSIQQKTAVVGVGRGGGGGGKHKTPGFCSSATGLLLSRASAPDMTTHNITANLKVHVKSVM